MNYKYLTFGVLVVILVLGIASTATRVNAAPFYTKTSKWMIVFMVQPVDPNGKSNDCFKEIYARATPKNNNHDLLNKEIKTNTPSNNIGKIYAFKWFFDIATFHQSDATNEGKIRDYAFLEFPNGLNGQTVTKYIPLSQAKQMTVDGRTVFVLDFQRFTLVTDPKQCAPVA